MKPLCIVPFVEAFTNNRSGFRNCCVADPQIHSAPNQDFADWWTSSDLEDFRQRLCQPTLPKDCHRCQLQEQTQSTSLRLAVNHAAVINDAAWPSRWNVMFGNICNLACWTCNEGNSSVIANHKKRIQVLPETWVDPQREFEKGWPKLEQHILQSYQHHEQVSITILGGEPLYNQTVLVFLKKLKDLGLAKRTKLEFHTNGTKLDIDIAKLIIKLNWLHVCVFVSVDAVGKKSEWLRYGSNWNQISANVAHFQKLAHQVEIHCTLSVLNLRDLPNLNSWASFHGLPLKIVSVSYPEFMCLGNWDMAPEILADRSQLGSYGAYYDLIGSTAIPGTAQKLWQYIAQFSSVRKSLWDFDDKFAQDLTKIIQVDH